MIVGNMGYVGPTVVQTLRQLHPNSTLTGFDTGFFAHNLTTASRLPESLLNQQVFGDVREFPQSCLEGVDTVIALAAISNDPMGDRYQAITHDINFEATLNLARKAKAQRVKHFVFASSCSIYGFVEGGPRRESDALNPLTAYARSKVATEEALLELADETFTITCLRFATACGWSERLRLDLVLNDFVAGAIAKGSIHILSDGTPWRPLIAVSDMALAISWAMARPADNGGRFLAINTGSNEWNYQVKELAAAVAAAIPGVEICIDPAGAPDKRSYSVNFDLFGRLAPEHQPRVSLAEAVQGLKQGLESIGFADSEFRESDLIRLRVIANHLESGRLNPSFRWQQA